MLTQPPVHLNTLTNNTGFPKGRILDIGCGNDFTIVATAPWTGIGPMQVADLEDCAVRVLQATVRRFLSALHGQQRLKKEYSKVWHIRLQRYFYRHEPTGERTWRRPVALGQTDTGIRVLRGGQQVPSLQGHAEDTLQQGPHSIFGRGGGAFIDGTPGITDDEHAVVLHDWNHTRAYRRLDPLRISLADGRTDRNKKTRGYVRAAHCFWLCV
jgi:hypothetical protein